MMEVIGLAKFILGVVIAGMVFIPVTISLFIQKYFIEILLIISLSVLIGIKNKKMKKFIRRVFE